MTKEVFDKAFIAFKEKHLKQKVLQNYCDEKSGEGYRLSPENMAEIDEESYYNILYMFMMKFFHAQPEQEKPLWIMHFANVAKSVGQRSISLCDFDLFKQSRGRQFFIDLKDFSVSSIGQGYNRELNLKKSKLPLPEYITRGVMILKSIYHQKEKGMERSYIMFKPGFVKREIIEDVMDRIEHIGGQITRMRLLQLSQASLEDHYPHLLNLFNDKGESVFSLVSSYMRSQPVLGCIVEGEKGIVAKIREITGPTRNAPKGTIRGDYALDGTRNVIHASDPTENPEGEIERFFCRDRELGIKVLAEFNGKENGLFSAIENLDKNK